MEQVQLDYMDFVGELRKKLYQIIPTGMEIEVHSVLKNNSIRLDSLVMSDRECCISPNFYLREYYNDYKGGRAIVSLAYEIYGKWLEVSGRVEDLVPDLAFEKCSPFIVYRLVNADRNRELLEQVPNIPFFDLAVTFYSLVGSQEDGVRSIRIDNQLMEKWGMDTYTLLKLAGSNTPRLFPVRYCPVSQALQGFSDTDQAEVLSYGAGEPYLLTNQQGINGAAAWLYPNQMEQISQGHGKDLYILPSSVHELIVLAEEDREQEERLVEMVREVNRECVSTEDYLSDHVYLYDYQKRTIKMIA